MTPIFVTVRPWTVAVDVGALHCQFEPLGWLVDRTDAGLRHFDSPVQAVVEVRFPAGSKGQVALLGARLTPADRDDVELAVGHSGVPPKEAAASCIGLLGKAMVPGLPPEYLPGVLRGLSVNTSPLPVGRLEVVAGAHDLVDSSQFAFERAGMLLRLVVSRTAGREACDDQVVGDLVRKWRGRTPSVTTVRAHPLSRCRALSPA
jgi:hypothetical protein